jgi:hypothetical protein
MRQTFVLALIVLLGAHGALAQPEQESHLLGAGVFTCRTWTVDHHSQNVAIYVEEAWVFGFLSAIGYVHLNRMDPLHGMDGGAVDSWIDNYCSAHPLDRIAEAASAFIAAHPH